MCMEEGRKKVEERIMLSLVATTFASTRTTIVRTHSALTNNCALYSTSHVIYILYVFPNILDRKQTQAVHISPACTTVS